MESNRRSRDFLYFVILGLTFSAFLFGHSTGSEWKLSAELVGQVRDMKSRALDWLLSQRTEDFGWAGDTARVVTALAAVLEDWPRKSDLEARLSAKQLEVELLAKLLRHGIDPISPARTAHYALALNAICKDPHDFYGHNLIGSLEKHHADYEYPGYPETFGFSLSSLVTCLGGAHLHKHQVRHLVQISRDDSRIYGIDTKAVALMALKCAEGARKSETLNRHIREGLEALGGLQRLDGSFGNTHTTAMALEGLGMDEDLDGFWNGTSGILALAALQDPNGSFSNDIYGTTDALMAISALLNGAGVLSLKRGRCSSYTYRPFDPLNPVTEDPPKVSTSPPFNAPANTSPSEGTKGSSPTPAGSTEAGPEVTLGLEEGTTSHPADPPPALLTVKYFLWIGPEPPTADKHNLTITVPLNTTFFRVMQRAAELDSAYEFSSTVWPNGHYVHTISGHREQPIGYHYWLLYRLPAEPDQNTPPPTTYVAPAGVDDLIVADGDVYLFWFKKI